MSSRVLKRRRSSQRRRPWLGFLYVLGVFSVLFFVGLLGVFTVGNAWLSDLPDYSDADAYNFSQKTEVYANDRKTLLAEFYVEDRDPVEREDISPYVWEGTVATEDQRFYDHHGIDPQGILRAVAVNLFGIGHEGASTITQQLVRNTILASEASESTLKRKVREAYIAVKMEQMYSKEDILLMYLNTINYGSGVYGIQAASQRYFSKNADQLTLAEAAALIGIPQSPTYNNPIDHPDACKERRNLVLGRMLANNVITEAEYDEACAAPLKLKVKETETSNGLLKYPYFSSYIRDTLLEMYDFDMVYKGGLTVYSTLDPKLQQYAEDAARTKESYIEDYLEVAMTVIDPATGYVKAIVGGKDFNKDQYNLATQAQRQPGSSFKTFTLVGCIENKMDPFATYVGCPMTITIDDWTLSNDSFSDYGTQTVANAFAVSSNTGFARLCLWLTPMKVAEVAKRMGIDSDLNAVPSITLGSQQVTTIEMAEAYATIASGGIHRESSCIEEIQNSSGRTIYQPDTTGERVISEEVAAEATKVMQGVIGSSGTAPDAVLANGREAAGKTGTSENYRDSWFCGFTPEYSVAIWLGNRQEQSTGAATASGVFPLFMDAALADVEPKKFPTKDLPDFIPVDNDALAISSTGYNSVDNAYNAYSYDFTYTDRSGSYKSRSNYYDEEGVDEDGDGYDDATGEPLDDDDGDEDDSDEYDDGEDDSDDEE
ncbi:MAG: transglycosylase domain-containing protein [Coriobacteriaceae bacterium]|nr:transglycosylase domain-containing protein [Coriobacteriaceae bacterium]